VGGTHLMLLYNIENNTSNIFYGGWVVRVVGVTKKHVKYFSSILFFFLFLSFLFPNPPIKIKEVPLCGTNPNKLSLFLSASTASLKNRDTIGSYRCFERNHINCKLYLHPKYFVLSFFL
jgi:hypothetical protein